MSEPTRCPACQQPLPKEPGSACPSCGTTPAAAGVLGALVTDLNEIRPDDTSWGFAMCPACGQVTGVWDDHEGWSFGTRPVEILGEAIPTDAPFAFVP